MASDPKWTMPTWMEPYRHMFQNTGGNSIESLMQDVVTDAFSNAIRSALIISVDCQVTLLHRLHSVGALVPDESTQPWEWDSAEKKWRRLPDVAEVKS